MIIDGRRILQDRLEAAVCIVGSGMGGASVAKPLVEAGVDVLFVEAGGEGEGGGPPPVRHEVVGREFGLRVTRALEVGGSTNLWHGICAPLDPIDFEARPWIEASGWPLSYRDLAPHYAAAREWLGVGDRAAEAGAPVGDVARLTAKPFWTCRTPARMKQAVLRWAGAGRARCLTHAVALEFQADGDGRVRRLRVGCGDRFIEVAAEVFIAAAGGLETPRLLLNSGRAVGRGFGDGAALTGRYLMDHPVAYFSQVVFERPQGPVFGTPTLTGHGQITGLAPPAEVQRRLRLPNHYVFLRPGVGPARVPNDRLRLFLGVRGVAGLRPRHVAAMLTSPYVLQRVVRERFGLAAGSRFGDIYVMAEQVPNPDSRVALSDRARDRYGYPVAQVDWRMRPGEWDHFGHYMSVVADGLRADARIASIRMDPPEEWPRVLSSAAHHLGTARMADTAARGVVDADLRVFGCANLFVCDGSVFPTVGGTNPSLTISALALRLGARLARQLASPIESRAAV